MTFAKTTTPFPLNEPIIQYTPNSPEKQRLMQAYTDMARQPIKVPLIINGKEIFDTGAPTEKVFCPHDKKKEVATLSVGTAEHIKGAVKATREAREHWSRLPWEERASIFLKAADLITTKYRYLLNASTMLAQSKSCYQAEIDATCELADFLRFNVKFAEQLHSIQPMHSPFGMWNRTEVRPLEGFVYAISPFNFTSISINLAAAPALMGCTVVWKPSAQVALGSYYGLKLLEEAGLPPGVINMVYADPQEMSKILLEDRELGGIHFTGSTATFQSLWKQSASNLHLYRDYPRLVGETGGKDFVFAHPSAHVDQLVTALVRGAFEFQGQKCSAASRAYIPESLWPTVKEKMISEMKKITLGSPEDYSHFMNAVIDKKSFTKIKSYIDYTKTTGASSAKILAGGGCNDEVGYFIEPTLIQTTDPKYKTMVEEIFGPVLTVYVYADAKIKETLKLCDESTPYALTGGIFAQDRYAVAELTQELRYSAGNFYVNDKPTGAVVGQQPFGGSRMSGTNDKAGSMFNLLRWTSPRTLKENFLPPVGFEYPYMG